MTQTNNSCSGVIPHEAGWWQFRACLVVYLVALVLVLVDVYDGQALVTDVDDILREVQIRRLLSGEGDWWNLTLPIIGLPEPYVSPWSRLVDLPYLLVAKATTPILGQERAISACFLLVPPILLALYSVLVSMIWLRTLPSREFAGTAQIVVATLAMALAIYEFSPGRIDHHNIQLVALLGIAAGVSRWDELGGIIAGFFTVLSVAVGLEGLPFVIVIFASLMGGALFGNQQARMVVSGASIAILVVTVPIAFVILGPAGMLAVQCDSFSSPYIVLLLGCSGILLFAARTLARVSSIQRVTATILLGLVTIVTVGILFPDCLAGPYWMIDPISRRFWLDRVPHEQGLLQFGGGGPLVPIGIATAMFAVLATAAPTVMKEVRSGRPSSAIIFAAAVASFVLMLWVTRYMRFAFAFVPLFMPQALQYIENAGGQRRDSKPLILIGFCVAIAATVMWLLASPRRQYHDAAEAMARSGCSNADMSALQQIKDGHLLAPPLLAMAILKQPLGSNVTVGPIPFHRASPAIKRLFEGFLSVDMAVRLRALEPFNYLAFCQPSEVFDKTGNNLFDALAKGKAWPGLTRIAGDDRNPFQLYRLDHPNLR